MENYKKIKLIKDSFFSYFGMAGYNKISPAPLIPEQDDSVLFSNSAILPFKSFLKEETPKLFNLQKCIRFRGAKDLLNPDEVPYISTFEMAGCIVPANALNELLDDTRDFMLNTLNISPQKLYMDLSSEDKQLVDLFSKDYDIKFDRLPPDKYQGRFGMPDVMGRCAHFSMFYRDGLTHNFGKIIAIYSNGNISSYAFGFGIEKYLYMQGNKENYYEATSIYDLAKDIKSPIAWKYMNAVSSMCHLYSDKTEYDNPKYSKQKKILKSMSYKLAVISELLDIPEARLRRDIELYSRIEYQGNVNVEQLMESVRSSKQSNPIQGKQIQHLKLFLDKSKTL